MNYTKESISHRSVLQAVDDQRVNETNAKKE